MVLEYACQINDDDPDGGGDEVPHAPVESQGSCSTRAPHGGFFIPAKANAIGGSREVF